MGSNSYSLLRRLLFSFDPETSHLLALRALRTLQRTPGALSATTRRFARHDPRLGQTLLDMHFPNPLGLAAGFDKDACIIHAMAALGFGSIEVGTVTPKPQPGNPRPRLFRLSSEDSLQNAMGFNNEGLDAALARLMRDAPFPVPIGLNVGKNKDTPQEAALEEYLGLISALDVAGDYGVVNISSPNTPGLRDFQNEDFVGTLFSTATGTCRKPLFLKIAPDSDTEGLVALATVAVEAGAAGIIATNTSIDYALSAQAKDFGGISGKLIRDKSFRVLEALAEALHGKTILISVGGIDSGAEAYRRLQAGASLLQAYTGLIYRGPGFAAAVNRDLLQCMDQNGIDHISQIAGSAGR
jgi:dihydroorotate dehydrogenase